MLSRVARGLTHFSSYVNKSRQIAVHQYQFARLLNHSPVLSVAKQVEDSADLLFDLGGSPEIKTTNTSRKPSKENKSSKFDSKTNANVKKSKKKIEIADDKKDRSFEQLKYHDVALNLTYVKLPFGHPELSTLMLNLKSRKYRDTNNLLLIEGRRLTLEAVEVGLKLKYLLFSNIKQLEDVRGPIQKSFTKQTEFIRVPHNDLSFWSTLTTCPGLISVFEKPKDMNIIWENVRSYNMKYLEKIQKKIQNVHRTEVEDDKVQDEINTTNVLMDSIPITVICDQVREPNNLGSIIRTCAAVPCSQIILLKGCADPWDVKSLRSGCGAQFRVPIIGPIEWEEINAHLPDANELSIFIADNQTEDQKPLIARDESETKRKENNAQFFQPKVYSDIAFHNCKHIALIIGGETEGVSSHAFDFMRFISNEAKAQDTNIKDSNVTIPDNNVIEIPLGNGIESLNASVATAILLFEMRKQLIQ